MKKSILFLLVLAFSLTVTAQYHSLFWKISGNGLKKPSYLFGTMHISDARVLEHTKTALKRISDVKAYAMELDPDKMMDPSVLKKMTMGKGYSLKKMIPEADYRFLDSICKSQSGYSLSLFDNIEPLTVAAMYEAVQMGLNGSFDGSEDMMDLHFYHEAKKQKKKIIGIETVDEQLAALNSMSYEEQAKMLVDEIHSSPEKQEEGPDALRFYINQDLDSLAGMDTEMPAALYEIFVTNRNKRMADRIGEFIKKAPTFIAIGALHLPGKDGVIGLLRKQGYTVEPKKD